MPSSGGPRPGQGSAGAQVVQICHKGPDRAGVREENCWYSALSFAVDPGPGRLCGRFGHDSAPGRHRSPTRPIESAGASPQRASTGNDAAHHPGEKSSLVLEGTSGGEDLFEPVRGERLGG